MNLILLDNSDLSPDTPDQAIVRDTRRLTHLRTVLRVAEGDRLVVGHLHGAIGTAQVLTVTAEAIRLQVALTAPPPPRAPVLLVLALPRPKVIRRTLQDLAALGVEQVVLLHAARVEKSFWSSPFLAPEAIEAALRLGLEQARDTRPPEILLRPRFRPFVEDELPALVVGRRCLLAHPYAEAPLPRPAAAREPVALAVGPEGGWHDFELDLLVSAAGFLPVHAGPRILRSETALPYLLGALTG